MNQNLAEAIIVRWAGKFGVSRPPLASLAELAETVAKHLPDPAFNGAPSATTVVYAPSAPPPQPVARKKLEATRAKGGRKATHTTCSVPGCKNPHKAKKLCMPHWRRQHAGVSLDVPLKGCARASKTAKEDDPAPAAAVEAPEKTTDKPIAMSPLKVREDAMYQRKTCRRYQRCTLVARKRGWAGWSCSACTGPGTPQ